MVRFEGALLCLMVMIMDLIAGILGIEAEIAQNKVHSWILICRMYNGATHMYWVHPIMINCRDHLSVPIKF